MWTYVVLNCYHISNAKYLAEVGIKWIMNRDSAVTTLWRYRNVRIIIIILNLHVCQLLNCTYNAGKAMTDLASSGATWLADDVAVLQ